ncbi:energy-coupling factor ABC transporter ATP-binding protein [Breznakiellaceae bacterium SP9]
MTNDTLFSLKDCSKVFPSPDNKAGCAALSKISLDIHAGQCLVIAGPNGSGKSVLMRILAGLLDYTSGQVLFKGRPLRNAGTALRREVGLMFQDADAQIIGETVADDIAFGPKNVGLKGAALDATVAWALDYFGLSHKQNTPPGHLSGGEKRRLSAAGILAMGCNTIILDEPFANLDYHGVCQVLRVIKEQKEAGRTLIILTHELEKVLALGDRLVILAGGTVQDDGPLEAVLDRLKSEYGIRDPRQNYSSVEECTWLN